MEKPRSKQGRAVLAAVHALDHPAADQVFVQVRIEHPRISLGTVYRNLEALVQTGLIGKREIGGSSRYDPNTSPHLHLHDTSSDQLRDIPIPPSLQAELQTICNEHFQETADCIIELKGAFKT